MKKIVFGGIMMLGGIISTALLLSGTMATGMQIAMYHNGQYSFIWSLHQYQLIVPLIVFVIIAVVGFALSIWGLFDKKDK